MYLGFDQAELKRELTVDEIFEQKNLESSFKITD
jgi:hypothetical protein